MRTSRTVAGALALATALALGSSCTTSTRPMADCPQTWDSVVTWSGDEAATELQFYDGATLAGRLPVQAQGASLDDPMIMKDGTAYFVTLGDTTYDKTTIVSVDLASCAVGMKQLEQQSILQHSVDGDQLFSTSGLNNVGHLHVNDLATGAQLADITTPGAESMGVTADREHLYAFSRNDDEPGTKLITIDRANWKITASARVSDVQLAVSDAALVDGKIYYAASPTATGARPPSSLGVVDLANGKVSELKLQHPMPYQIEVDPTGRRLFIAHTFLNETFGPTTNYRFVTRLDLATGQLTSFDTGPRLGPISLSGDGRRMVSLHADYDGDVKGSYAVTTLETGQTSSVAIAPHEGDGYHYLAAVTAR